MISRSRPKPKTPRLSPGQIDELINSTDMEPVLSQRVRVVRWLYNNSNKLTRVYEEKLVRLMVLRLQQKIWTLESKNASLEEENARLKSKIKH